MLKFQKKNLEILNKLKSKLCLECQECCLSVIIPHTAGKELKPASVEFWEARGIKVKKDDKGYYLIIPFPCPHLPPEGCNIYKTRPQVCRNYDGRKAKHRYIRDVCKWNEINIEEE